MATILAYKKGVVSVKGYGQSLTVIGDFVEALQSSKYFSSVDFQGGCYVSTSPIKAYPFNFRFRFDADPEKINR